MGPAPASPRCHKKRTTGGLAVSQQQQPYRKGKSNGPRRKTGRGGGGDGGNAASLDGEISSGGAAACGSSGCWPGLSTLHDLTPSRLCLSLLVLFLNRGPKSLSMWGVEVGITPGLTKRWHDRPRHTLPRDPVLACLPPTPLHRCIGLRVRSLNDPHDARLRPFNRHTLEPAAASRCEPTHPSPSAC